VTKPEGARRRRWLDAGTAGTTARKAAQKITLHHRKFGGITAKAIGYPHFPNGADNAIFP
jgi:hypothetical protein